jgi:hypothetical protein
LGQLRDTFKRATAVCWCQKKQLPAHGSAALLKLSNSTAQLVRQDAMASTAQHTCVVNAWAVLALSLHIAAYAALLNTCSCTSGEAAKLTHACHSSCSLQQPGSQPPSLAALNACQLDMTMS